jgi:hypothetical protein
VLVFQLVNFHSQQLELGAHAARQLRQQVASQIKQSLGSGAAVSVGTSGTIVAMLSGERETAERAAQDLVRRLESEPLPLNGRGATAVAALAFGIIAFPPAEEPVRLALPVPMLEADLSGDLVPSIPS